MPDLNMPQFPMFVPLELKDQEVFQTFFSAYRPEISELTFTNLFIWRSHYKFQWSIYRDWLVIISVEGEYGTFAIEPIGPSPRYEITRLVLEWMRDEKNVKNSRIERADNRIVEEVRGINGISVEPTRDHFDYVYLRDDLVKLGGNRYRSKRNHINQLVRAYSYRYEQLAPDHINDCIAVQEKWCLQRRCEDDMDLLGEWDAVKEILRCYMNLNVQGAVITIENKVVAFTIGQMLNENTAVIHIEKADPEIPGLYPVINQQFCENNWQGVRYINREQDLGIPGLREAKLSYYPDHMVNKFRIMLNQ
ncbi:MAG TPA: phosphatidylglycerol lysyltransferase domain-containing protein [Syntrophorhabdus sp.]|nr:phosphatidylglycerol lysyltransferase domain-containing protein [Syntrophorhabdus sp.]HOH27810.1 phosphatidylglycerol lysyltransferase domain-containing protein [Syntrophorhabdus sp.]HPB39110.1 phosphatidylglycerol lysyltransferase domain-containing protein [Syntrophorhabdus sp.]